MALNNELVTEASSREYKIIASNNLGKFYKHINSRLNHRTGIPQIIDKNSNYCVSDLDKAEVFSEYFSSFGTDDNGILPRVLPNTDFPDFTLMPNFSSLSFDPTRIIEAIAGLNGKASPGPNTVPAFFFDI